jgi:acetyl esterase/lipase
MFLNRQIAFFLGALLCLNSYGQQYSKSWKDLNYSGDEMEYHRLDIYLPSVEKPLYPVVISIYGSAWFGNNLKGSDLATIGKALLDAGFAVVTPNHRSSMDAKFPAQIHDIKAVIRFIRANASLYQIDTSFIGITGISSGGHLAALAGTSGSVHQFTVGQETADLEGSIGAYTAYSSSVHAVVDWFGPTDFMVLDSCRSNPVYDDANSPESILIGEPVLGNRDKCALANPLTYIDSDDPPFFILHGDADQLVPHCQSDLLFNALQEEGVPVQYILVPDAQHGPGLLIDQYFKTMTDFFTAKSGITNVKTGYINTPQRFSLAQNYPNPFNPSTLISFYLPTAQNVTVKIFSTFGQEIETLIFGELAAGQHELSWSPQNHASGLYIYSLQAGDFNDSKRMVFQK